MKSIPVNVPKLDGNEAKYLVQAIESGWISSEGPFVNQFEQQFAKRHGRKHAIAVSSGTAALQCSVNALDLSPGDEIIIPSFTIISCVIPVIESGATPVLVDCDPETFNSAPEQIISAITPKTKAIMLVHIYGLPVDADPILEIARERGIKIIEDTAEAIGLEYKNRACGSLGDVSTFSFYPNKHITTGEGGMVLTDDDQIAERCQGARNLCLKEPRRFRHTRIGWNFRMTNIQAAIGLAQLEKLDQTISRKRWIGNKYNDLLDGCASLQLPLPETSYAKNIYWVYPVVLNDSCPLGAPEAMAKLEELKIGTRPFFYPMHKQPVFRKMGLFENQSLVNSEHLAERGFYIPAGIGISEEEIHFVVDSLRNTVGN
jgi:perosamine synthetase